MGLQDRSISLLNELTRIRAFDLLKHHYTIDDLLHIIPQLQEIPQHIRDRVGWDGLADFIVLLTRRSLRSRSQERKRRCSEDAER
jgi:hypothetical protein